MGYLKPSKRARRLAVRIKAYEEYTSRPTINASAFKRPGSFKKK